MIEVQITESKLWELRVLADWQLKEMGFDPVSITLAVMKLEEAGKKDPNKVLPKFFPAYS